jgi:hypothetical protein
VKQAEQGVRNLRRQTGHQIRQLRQRARLCQRVDLQHGAGIEHEDAPVRERRLQHDVAADTAEVGKSRQLVESIRSKRIIRIAETARYRNQGRNGQIGVVNRPQQ